MCIVFMYVCVKEDKRTLKPAEGVMHTVIFKYYNTHTHTHIYREIEGGREKHIQAYSINHDVLWPYLLNANIMDLSDKPLPFSL